MRSIIKRPTDNFSLVDKIFNELSEPLTFGLQPFSDVFHKMSSLDENQLRRHTYPKVDQIEKSDKTILQATVPGLNKEQVNVTIDGDILSITCEQHDCYVDDTDATYTHKEIRRSKSSRSFRLSENHIKDDNKIDVVMKDGMLTISIPKIKTEPTNEPKKLKIK